MGYILRVRLASFFAGAAAASFVGLYILRRDYKIAHESISHQFLMTLEAINLRVMLGQSSVLLDCVAKRFDEIKGIHGSLDSRISALEKINRDEASQHVQATE